MSRSKKHEKSWEYKPVKDEPEYIDCKICGELTHEDELEDGICAYCDEENE